MYELDIVEAGKKTNASNTKSFVEAGYKPSKALKDTFVELLEEAPSHVRDIKACGFTLSGSKSAITLDAN